jgi:hypothetical protein
MLKSGVMTGGKLKAQPASRVPLLTVSISTAFLILGLYSIARSDAGLSGCPESVASKACFLSSAT